MCAALVARGAPVRSRSTEILCAGSFSIVVEGADGEPPDENDVEIFEDFPDRENSLDLAEGGSESLLSSPKGSLKGSRRGSKSSTKEETESKLAFFKTEAAARLRELERLLDEHDQIVRELKRSESTNGLQAVGVGNSAFPATGASSAPFPGTPVEGIRPKTPSIVISRTAPASPELKKARPHE